MIGKDPKNVRMVALFLLGLVLFNPPLMDVFDTGATSTVMGVPLLFFYVFAAWAALIGLMVVVVERREIDTEIKALLTEHRESGDLGGN